MAAATGVGALIYGRWVAGPALAELPAEARAKALAGMVGRMRPILFTVMGALLASGLWNLIVHFAEKPPRYHMIFGIKLLLALHVFTMWILLSIPPGANPARDAKRPRLLATTAVSATLVLLLSAWLRRGF